VFFLLLLFSACQVEGRNMDLDKVVLANEESDSIDAESITNEEGSTIETRFNPPFGYKRLTTSVNSFSSYLRSLPLKPVGSEVKLFDGTTKFNSMAYVAVVDLKIGTKDLHQCADAVMHLRAEYFWNRKEYDKIHFNFTNGFRASYSEWMLGKRIVVKGNTVNWIQANSPSNTYADFWGYLEQVFTYAGTLSLSQELVSVEIKDIQIGDIFIRGGSPGHAVIVVDLAYNEANRKTVFMLAQSYMPAQEIQILRNPNDTNISPWYTLDFTDELQTSEWVFKANELKRFVEENE
jgi:hypothetical protein